MKGIEWSGKAAGSLIAVLLHHEDGQFGGEKRGLIDLSYEAECASCVVARAEVEAVSGGQIRTVSALSRGGLNAIEVQSFGA